MPLCSKMSFPFLALRKSPLTSLSEKFKLKAGFSNCTSVHAVFGVKFLNAGYQRKNKFHLNRRFPTEPFWCLSLLSCHCHPRGTALWSSIPFCGCGQTPSLHVCCIRGSQELQLLLKVCPLRISQNFWQKQQTLDPNFADWIDVPDLIFRIRCPGRRTISSDRKCFLYTVLLGKKNETTSPFRCWYSEWYLLLRKKGLQRAGIFLLSPDLPPFLGAASLQY